MLTSKPTSCSVPFNGVTRVARYCLGALTPWKQAPNFSSIIEQPLADTCGYSPILAYNAIGEYELDDSIASLLDKRQIAPIAWSVL